VSLQFGWVDGFADRRAAAVLAPNGSWIWPMAHGGSRIDGGAIWSHREEADMVLRISGVHGRQEKTEPGETKGPLAGTPGRARGPV